MTRINCIPVEELTSKHLVAEYRELPRVFKLARYVANAPKEYTLGTGHVTFFYDKLAYCYERQKNLVDEMLRRGYKPTLNPAELSAWENIKPSLWGSWEPTAEAMAINRQRIQQRLEGIK